VDVLTWQRLPARISAMISGLWPKMPISFTSSAAQLAASYRRPLDSSLSPPGAKPDRIT
jgi:hypothetical protein